MIGRRYFLVGWRFISTLVLVWDCLDFPAANADCGAPPDIDGASHNLTGSPPHLVNTQIQYHCDIGYIESGLSRTYICHGTHWVGGEDFRCTEFLCAFIDPPENGVFTNDPTYTVGSRIEFGCHEGYDLEGPTYRRCRVDGWTSSSPVCRVKMCGEFGGVDDAELFQENLDGVENDYGSEITVTCHQNHVLSGSYRVVCGADGQWSTPPTCQPSDCGPYPVSPSRCTSISLVEDVMYYLSCVEESENVSVTQVGGSSAACFNNHWSDTTMACYCDCKIHVDTNKVILHNVDGNNFLAHDTVLQWSCRLGNKVSELEFRCDDGNIDQPDCILPPTTTTSTTTTTTPTTTTSTTTRTTQTSTTTTLKTTMTSTPSRNGSLISTDSANSSTVVNTTTAQRLSTQPPVIESSTVIQNTQVSMNISICSCDCYVQIDRGLLGLYQIDKSVNIEYNPVCSEYTDSNDSPAKTGLFCEFGERDTALCKQSGRRYSRDAMTVWDNVSKRLPGTVKTKMNHVCGCRKVSESLRSNATPLYNVNILHICVMISTMVWSNKLIFLLLISYIGGF